MTRIAIVDYGMGNRRSVHKALEHVGADVALTADTDAIDAADGVIVPGVGAFPAAMRNLDRLGLTGVIRDAARAGTPVLGICLGMQLLFERSVELEPVAGLGLLGGEVTPLRTGGLRVPHIGWNDVVLTRPSPLTAGLPPGGAAFYHVHSLAVRPSKAETVLATTEYGETFATIVGTGRVFGVQFHPEKSSAHGLALLDAFVALSAEAARADSASAAAPAAAGA